MTFQIFSVICWVSMLKIFEYETLELKEELRHASLLWAADEVLRWLYLDDRVNIMHIWMMIRLSCRYS